MTPFPIFHQIHDTTVHAAAQRWEEAIRPVSSTLSIRPLGCWSSRDQINDREIGVAHELK
jgi:hypothetical protein